MCSQISSQMYLTIISLSFIDRIDRHIDTLQNSIVENTESWKNSKEIKGLIQIKSHVENWDWKSFQPEAN